MNAIRRLWRSSIGKKIVMALTGLILVGFLVSHMISNVLVFVDPAKLDHYGEWLRSFGALLWVARAGLLAAVLLHIVAAWQLTQMARAARGGSYARHEQRVATYASRTMRWGGVLILVFVVFHLLHYTFGTVHPDFRPGEVGRNLIVGCNRFRLPSSILVSMIAIGAHFWHGIWSVFQTLGINIRRGQLVAAGASQSALRSSSPVGSPPFPWRRCWVAQVTPAFVHLCVRTLDETSMPISRPGRWTRSGIAPCRHSLVCPPTSGKDPQSSWVGSGLPARRRRLAGRTRLQRLVLASRLAPAGALGSRRRAGSTRRRKLPERWRLGLTGSSATP